MPCHSSARKFGTAAATLGAGVVRPGQVLDSAGTAVNTLKKVGPRKVFLHPKLPDQKNVRRIFKEIESKDERLELNLYIVGESGEEEEGAMAEGSQES